MKKCRRKISWIFIFALLPFFWACAPPPVLVSDDISTNITYSCRGRTVDVLYDYVLTERDAWRLYQIVKKNRSECLNLHLFNPGGNAFVMFDVLNTLERLEAEGVRINTFARGYIASAAVPIFVMGKERVISRDCWAMMHPGAWKGKEALVGEKTMRVFEAMEKRYAEIVVERTGFTYEEIACFMNIGSELKDEHGRVLDSNSGVNWFDAQEALEKGLATRIA